MNVPYEEILNVQATQPTVLACFWVAFAFLATLKLQDDPQKWEALFAFMNGERN